MYRLLCFLLLLGCAPKHLTDAYDPSTHELALWGTERFLLDPDWQFAGHLAFSVRGQLWNSNLTPIDRMETLVFFRPTQGLPELLLASRVRKNTVTEYFRFLGGDKINIRSHAYREALYALSANSTDREYRRYLQHAHAQGIAVAPSYRVRVLDRLPMETTLTRIMICTPGTASTPLPPFGKLYPQERKESVPRHFF